MKDCSLKERRDKLIERIDELNGDEARRILKMVFSSLVTDTAGSSIERSNMFTYMWTRDFDEICTQLRQEDDGDPEPQLDEDEPMAARGLPKRVADWYDKAFWCREHRSHHAFVRRDKQIWVYKKSPISTPNETPKEVVKGNFSPHFECLFCGMILVEFKPEMWTIGNPGSIW